MPIGYDSTTSGLTGAAGFLQGINSVIVPELERRRMMKMKMEMSRQKQLRDAGYQKMHEFNLAHDAGVQLSPEDEQLFNESAAYLYGKTDKPPKDYQHFLAANPMGFGGGGGGSAPQDPAAAVAGGDQGNFPAGGMSLPGGGTNMPAAPTPQPTAPRSAVDVYADRGYNVTQGAKGQISLTKKASTAKERQGLQADAIYNSIGGEGDAFEQFQRASVGKTQKAVEEAGHRLYLEHIAQLAASGMSPLEARRQAASGPFGAYAKPEEQSFALGADRAGAMQAARERAKTAALPTQEAIKTGGFAARQSIVRERQKEIIDYRERAKGGAPLDKEAPLAIMPDGVPASEKPGGSMMSKDDAAAQGAQFITPKQKEMRTGVDSQIDPFLSPMLEILPMFTAEKTGGAVAQGLGRKIPGARFTNPDIQKLQVSHNDALSILRNVRNDRGQGMRGDLIKLASNNFLTEFESKQSAATKALWWGRVFRGIYAASGAPEPPKFRAWVRALEKQTKQKVSPMEDIWETEAMPASAPAPAAPAANGGWQYLGPAQ